MKLNLRNKFILYFFPLILGIFLFGGYLIHTFAAIHDQFAKLQKDVTPNALAMLELKRVLLSLETGITEKRIDEKEISAQISRLQKIVSAHEDHDGEIIDPVRKSTHDMMHHAIRTMSLSKYILSQSESGWQGKDLAEIADIIRKERLALGPVLDEHLAIHLRGLAGTEAFVSEKYRHTLMLTGVFIAIILLMSFVILMVMMRSILGPVKVLKEGARQFGEGNLKYDLKISSGDEFEYLAHEFGDMAEKLFNYHALLDSKVRERTKELSRSNEDLNREIQERQKAQEEQFRAEEQIHFLTQELLKVQENERQQISLDLHDNVAQELSSLKVAAETIFSERTGDEPGLQAQAKEWEKLLHRCIRTVRELSYNLRPLGLEQMGLASAAGDFCRSFAKQTGLVVHFSAAGMENVELDYTHSINIYRLIQEGLNNINRHAGASEASVRLLSSYPSIILRIDDNGRGFDPEEGIKKARRKKRFGLLGMQERVSMLGGTIKIRSAIDQGTKIFIEIPLQNMNDRRHE